MTRIFAPTLAALLILPVAAGGQGAPGGDAELARDLVARGEILPLARVLDLLETQHPGQVVEVELEYEDGILVYEIDVVTPEGRLIEVDMDATDGRIVDIDEEDED
ncbi:PepSY domain-containing protein [Paracoccus laeviglucosivorans]|uniref:Peptidase propeptide and YPEB domain-containing protein n=1 Tax=Paracoccus laeviglucosivorans TaxID=1197861 RepID=A0A521B3G4_9RHOB|nr:PepSY domain-containing protein [Paracoccus laeviglucosivorans]SMO41632.1 Peptidase propeptide and YPEB domain-containing protein [Paracoccus laeviglucosivorans]